ncbi:MAG: polyamine aminopropyltransferase [Fibrobacter sp.]|nr:polyamine aminopropyltransferase [Fibrobacter sp.]
MSVGFHPESGSSLWIQNLVNGLSGLTIRAKHALFCDSSPFQKIEVFDTYSFGTVLCLGGSVVITELDSDSYHEMIVHPAMIMHKKPERICIIGGGDGGCLKEVIKHDDVKTIVVVEIDSMVKETIDRFFPALAKGFQDSRVEVVFDDGYHYLKKNKKQFDVIIIDSFDPGGPVQSLETVDFQKVVAGRLAEDGIAVFQTDSPTVKGEFLRKTIQSVSPFFKHRKLYFCSMRSFPEGVCSFLICSKNAEVLKNFEKQRYASIAKLCTYYNDDVHVGAFLLPQNIKRLLK